MNEAIARASAQVIEKKAAPLRGLLHFYLA
jgi:hypothetical protein